MYNFKRHLKLEHFSCSEIVSAGLLLAQVVLCSGQSRLKVDTKNEVPSHYDVVSIKPANPEERGLRIGGTDDGFNAKNVTVAVLLENAYELREDSIIGIPPSLASKRFDIAAKLVDTSPQMLQNLSGEQRERMLDALLRDRFALKVHQSTKNAPVYILIQTKDGAKIKPSSESDRPLGVMPVGSITVSNGHLKAHAIPIASLIGSLAGAVQRTVIDETKLHGLYDFDLTWDPNQGGLVSDSGGSSNSVDAGPSLFTVLQDQLGLKLVPTKRSLPILVVDHIEMPLPN